MEQHGLGPRIGLLGATGYTGRLTAAELHRRGVDAVLGGRNPERLQAVSHLGETRVVDTQDPAALADFLDGLDAVISCVGPFATLGLPAVAAAARARVPYVDSTGEPAFMNQVYETYADAATPIVPACGFDYIPGDFGAAIAAELIGGDPEAVLVGYRSRGTKASRGTARSALGALSTVRIRPHRVLLAYPGGDVGALVLPWGEELTVARHLPGTKIDTAFVVPGTVSYAGPVVRMGAPLLTAAAPLLARLADRLSEGPPAAQRAQGRSDVLAVAMRGSTRVRVLVRATDVYALTATLLVEAALRVRAAPPGALSPAQAFDPRAFLDAVRGPLLSWEILDG